MTLALSKQLAALLASRGYNASLTRTDDRYLALDERTALTNKLAPDLFVSIHINSSTNGSLAGIETFCLTPGLFKNKPGFSIDALHKKRRESLYQNSQKAAALIHKNILTYARTIQPSVRDRKVKHKVPQVLFGIDSPGVLLEVGYLSNKQEGLLLQDSLYQNVLVQGMAKGIEAFSKADREV